jgi:hypothetical protein
MAYEIEKDIDYSDYEKILNRHFPDNLELAKRVFKIYRESDSPNKKDVFDIVILNDVLAFIFCSPVLKKFTSIVGTLETFKEHGELEQVIDVVSFFVMLQKKMYENEISIQKKSQTKNATEMRQRKLVELCTALEKYLYEVDCTWHSQKNDDGELLLRNSRTTKKQAINSVYEKYIDEINEILNKYGVKEDFIKQFVNCFEYYTKVFLSGQDGKTASGFAPEKRKARSEASKQRSREAAKKHWVKRHSK